MLVDSHCHLDFSDFSDELDDIVARAGESGIGWMQTISTKMTTFPAVRAVAERYDNIFCSVGVHPHEVETQPEVSTEELVELSNHPKVIGIGETGLDFFYENSPRQQQEESFIRHIEASHRTGLPIIIHTRDADDETMRILTEKMKTHPFTGLIHCFSATQELADTALSLGLYISISGIVTFKKADSLREIIKTLPLDRLLLETDAPYLAPVPHRGKRNEPAFTRSTAEYLATLKGVSYEECAKTTTDNFFRLFSKATQAKQCA